MSDNGHMPGTDSYEVKPLYWDTDFFGVKSCKLTLNDRLTDTAFQDALSRVDGYDFVCIANRNCDVENAKMIAEYTNAFIADINVRFTKRLKKESDFSTEAGFSLDSGCKFDKDIVNIANNAYINSRFVRDESLRIRNGGGVHAEWVKNAFNKPDKYFIRHRTAENRTNAFLLFSVSDSIATAELVGVSPESQHIGLGKALWNAFENYLRELEIFELAIGTQITNHAAMALYISRGCRISETTHISHWWRNARSQPSCQ